MKEATVLSPTYTIKISISTTETILDSLRNRNLYLSNPCGGMGLCGRCKIKIIPKDTPSSYPISPEDKKFFTEKELAEGYRLACKAYGIKNIDIFIDESLEEALLTSENYNMSLLSHITDCPNIHLEMLKYEKFDGSQSRWLSEHFPQSTPLGVYRKMAKIVNEQKRQISGEQNFWILKDEKQLYDIFSNKINAWYGIAVDVGTTTLYFELLDLSTGEKKASLIRPNRQRAYGFDIISRIMNANAGKLSKLSESIRQDILNGLEALCQSANISLSSVYKLVLAGNTVIIHLLLQIPCHSLAVYPFTPIFTEMGFFSFSEVFNSSFMVADSCKVIILPAISAYIGGDVTAGILFCRMPLKTEPTLLIDIGTNGEIVICMNDILYCTSMAAGPAFEGGNISCGVGSIPGAISKLEYENNTFNFETIGNQKPIGICGSGMIDALACLLNNQWIDHTGLLCNPYFDNGIDFGNGIYLTQKDIRTLQLAKSAMRAGIEGLRLTVGISYQQIQSVYLAGSFGNGINLENAATIGLIPMELKDKIILAGNSALGGCVSVLLNQDNEALIASYALCGREFNLSEHPNFNHLFMKYMHFGP